MSDGSRQWLPDTPGQWAISLFFVAITFFLGMGVPLFILLAPLILIVAFAEAIMWGLVLTIWYALTLPLRAIGLMRREAPKPEPKANDSPVYINLALVLGLTLGVLTAYLQGGFSMVNF